MTVSSAVSQPNHFFETVPDNLWDRSEEICGRSGFKLAPTISFYHRCCFFNSLAWQLTEAYAMRSSQFCLGKYDCPASNCATDSSVLIPARSKSSIWCSKLKQFAFFLKVVAVVTPVPSVFILNCYQAVSSALQIQHEYTVEFSVGHSGLFQQWMTGRKPPQCNESCT